MGLFEKLHLAGGFTDEFARPGAVGGSRLAEPGRRDLRPAPDCGKEIDENSSQHAREGWTRC
jgi:hypothetical protein